MSKSNIILIAFLTSLFIGTKAVCLGLGITFAIITAIELKDIWDEL